VNQNNENPRPERAGLAALRYNERPTLHLIRSRNLRMRGGP